MSASTESGPVSPVPARVPLPPPVGSVFALGWLMAELFDDRRRKTFDVRQPAFDGAIRRPDLERPQRIAGRRIADRSVVPTKRKLKAVRALLKI